MRELRSRTAIGEGVPVIQKMRILRRRVLRWFQPPVRAVQRDTGRRGGEPGREPAERLQQGTRINK